MVSRGEGGGMEKTRKKSEDNNPGLKSFDVISGGREP